MGRYARQAIADVPYHIINRGNNHQPIFFSDDDYHFFLESLALAKEKYPCRIYSFVFMTNHVHLILEPTEKAQKGVRSCINKKKKGSGLALTHFVSYDVSRGETFKT